MAYIKYKEITKYFNFSSYLPVEKLPKYVMDYVYEDEKILASYKTRTDHGIFTDKKIVLFDSYSWFKAKKQIYVIPYDSISTCSVIFHKRNAELSYFLDCGYPVRLKFINMSPIDKRRLSMLHSTTMRIITNTPIPKDDLEALCENKISFEGGDKK